MHDRYLNVDDPRPDVDVPPDDCRASAPGTAAAVQPAAGLKELPPAAGVEKPAPAAETPKAEQENSARSEDEVRRPEDEVDRCVRVTREVLLGRPGPHSLEAAAAEIERRLREGAKA